MQNKRTLDVDVVPVDDGEVGTKPTDREHNRHFFRNFADPSISDLYVGCMRDYIRSTQNGECFTHDNITSFSLKYRELVPPS